MARRGPRPPPWRRRRQVGVNLGVPPILTYPHQGGREINPASRPVEGEGTRPLGEGIPCYAARTDTDVGHAGPGKRGHRLGDGMVKS